MTDTAKATARPWMVRPDPQEFEAILYANDGTFIAHVMMCPERDANAALIVEAVNNYDRLRAVERLAGELSYKVVTCSRQASYIGLAEELQSAIQGGK